MSHVQERYACEVSSERRGRRWEEIRLAKLGFDAIASIRLGDPGPADFSAWRDKRLRKVVPASVARELNLMRSALSTARKDWGPIPSNPMEDAGKLRVPPPRDRLPTIGEVETMQLVAGTDPIKATARADHAFRFACETTIRTGEIVELRGLTN